MRSSFRQFWPTPVTETTQFKATMVFFVGVPEVINQEWIKTQWLLQDEALNEKDIVQTG